MNPVSSVSSMKASENVNLTNKKAIVQLFHQVVSMMNDEGQNTISSSTPYAALIRNAAIQHHIPASLISAVIRAESNYHPNAVSSAGAMGLMQLMPSTARSLGVTNPYNPEQNINAGAAYLQKLLNTFHGNETLAIAAYNAGAGAVSQYQGIPPYPETQNYVRRVLSYMGGDSHD